MTRSGVRPALLLTFLVAGYIALNAKARALYDAYAPGVPDGGRYSPSILPLVLLDEPHLWGDGALLIIWLVACAAFVVPPAMALMLVQRRTELFTLLGVAGLRVASGALSVREESGSDYIIFWPVPFWRPALSSATATVALILTGLTVAGFLAGAAGRAAIHIGLGAAPRLR